MNTRVFHCRKAFTFMFPTGFVTVEATPEVRQGQPGPSLVVQHVERAMNKYETHENNKKNDSKGEILLYQSENGQVKLEVYLQNETWKLK